MSKEIEMVDEVHTDICNFPALLLPGVRMVIKLTKAKSGFYLMSKAEVLRPPSNFWTHSYR